MPSSRLYSESNSGRLNFDEIINEMIVEDNLLCEDNSSNEDIQKKNQKKKDDKLNNIYDSIYTTNKQNQLTLASPCWYSPTYYSIYDEFSPSRTLPCFTSSFLRPGCTFKGLQQTATAAYGVSVEILHVNMQKDFLCGYFKIKGLTEGNPTLTTYFEGEIIGRKFTFYTRRKDWGANDSTDINHWNRFRSWRPFYQQIKKNKLSYTDLQNSDHLFMRWKECFLVPNHKVSEIPGASYAGFYYICFHKLTGEITGLYFHQSSEHYQQLTLSPDDETKGDAYASYEFI